MNAFLKKSKMFMSSAAGNADRRLYDVACFDAEQAVQLFLKAYVLKFVGFVPRTHGIRVLMGHLASVPKIDKKAVMRFVSDNRNDLIMLEFAYIRSRYSGEAYNRQDAKKCIEVAEKVIEFARRIVANS